MPDDRAPTTTPPRLVRDRPDAASPSGNGTSVAVASVQRSVLVPGIAIAILGSALFVASAASEAPPLLWLGAIACLVTGSALITPSLCR